MESASDPVWNVYDLFRTARLNVKYYTDRIVYWERINFIFDITLAISAPSSTIAGLWFLKTPEGDLVWKCFGVLSAFVALIKPEVVRACETA